MVSDTSDDDDDDSDSGKYPEFRKNPRTPKEMTNEICIEFKTVIFH